MIIDKDHFKYLYIQRGEVSDAYKQGFAAWKAAYEQSLDTIMENITPALPAVCRAVLDVGSGLGGIDVHLDLRFAGLRVATLDGLEDAPEVLSHAKPFNNAKLTSDFLRKNGVENHIHYPAGVQNLPEKFDLVVSFAAWGFHIFPNDYLPQVQAALAPKATIILDVRKARRDWIEDFVRAFGRPEILQQGKKHVRLAWTT
jgi:SAM-dependent methyltransferase